MNFTERFNNSARLVAVEVLNRYDKMQKLKRPPLKEGSAYVSSILSEFLPKITQKARATDLVMGTIRQRASIDLVLAAIADTPVKRISQELINFVRVAVYELVYCPQTADYSIINDAVENTKSCAAKKQVGFVNAVLRKVASQIIRRKDTITEKNIRQILPQNTSTGCLFHRPFLANPQNQPADYLSAAYSISHFLVADWLGEFGFEKTKQICIASNRKPGIYLRPNTLKTNTYKLAEFLTDADFKVDITEDDRMIKIAAPGNITLLPGFEEGLFSIQDTTASLPTIALNPSKDMQILDLCAAPGTKTIQLAELTNDKADITATDIDANRLLKLDDSIKRLGLNSITLMQYNKLAGHDQLFDIILLDVPCSNTAVLSKRPEMRLRLKQKGVEKLTAIQGKLLEKASKLLKPQGRICYSTCSILKQENHNRIEKFLAEHPDFTLSEENLTLPAEGRFGHDGGYYAILARS